VGKFGFPTKILTVEREIPVLATFFNEENKYVK
jgi:hypothetical protein